jgi:hypothetical protein
VLKVDAWHIHFMDVFRAAFPRTPWIFLFRDPVEVLASHSRNPGRHALPGALDPRLLGMTAADVTRCPRDEWPARVVAHYCEAALRHTADPLGRFLDYSSLPEAIWSIVGPHFGLPAGAGQIDCMREAARFDAKRPAAEFAPAPSRREPFASLARQAGLDGLYADLLART